MMKNILIVLTVLAMASVANAGLLISVDGVVDPPDTSITLKPSDHVVIDIHAVNQTGNIGAWLLIQGLGSIDASNPTNLWEQSTAGNMPDPPLADYIIALVGFGYPGVVDIIEIDIMDTSEPYTDPDGLVVDGLIFHCLGMDDPDFGDDVILTLLNSSDFSVLDTQVIHQIPEPITFALLGLGGLFLRRRK